MKRLLEILILPVVAVGSLFEVFMFILELLLVILAGILYLGTVTQWSRKGFDYED